MSRAPSPMIATGTPSAAGGWRMLMVGGVLTLAALAAYWNSFEVPFLLDDGASISDNPTIRHLGQLGDVLSPPPTAPTAARPLLNLTLALNYAGGGMSVRGYHAVNLLIHICAGLALLGIVRRTLLLPALRDRYGEATLPLATFAALLWMLHPLQTESVTYISQRAESLMGLFYLLTLYGFIRSVTAESRNCWLILSVAACFCGMATKQVMVTAPVLVLFYDRAFVSGSFRSALAGRRWYYASLTGAWLWLGFLMHQSSLVAVSVGFQSEVNWLTYALTELRVVTDYLKLAVWPDPLVFDYGPEILVANPLAAAPYALVIVALLTAVVLAWRRSPMAGFLGSWFFLILAPTSTVVPISAQPMAESRVYLPLAAVIVLVTLGIYALGRRRAFIVLGVMAVGLGALTIRRNYDYRSEVSIWEDTVAQLPNTARGHGNLGMALAKIPGRLPEAIAQYERALRIKPSYTEAHNNFANALATMPGRLPDAIAHYEEALRLKPASADVQNNLGMTLAKMPGRMPDAIAHFETALRLKPDYAEAHAALAHALAQLPGRMPDALAHFDEALRLKPDLAEAHASLATELEKLPGRMPDAVAHFEEALRLKPDFAEVHSDFAIALAKIPGRMPDAITHFEEALRLKPDLAEAHSNLAEILAQVPGRSADAVAHFEAALRLRPDYADAHNSFGITLAQMPGRMSEAITHFEAALRLNPNMAEVQANLAKALTQRPGRMPEVIAHYEAAVRLKPGFIEARYHLAMAYAAAGRRDAAIDQLEAAVRLNPTIDFIREDLEKLKARRFPRISP